MALIILKLGCDLQQHEVRSFTTRTEQPPKLEIDTPMSSPVLSRKTPPQANLLSLSVGKYSSPTSTALLLGVQLIYLLDNFT